MSIPGNLLSATTEAVDPDISGWAAALNCTLSLGSGGRNGPGCLVLTSTAAGEMQARTAAAYPITGGVLYEAFADASASTQPERIGIQWLDDTLTAVGSTTWSPTTTAASASWHRISVAGVAPSAATHARVVISATATAGAANEYAENVYLGPPFRTSGNLFSFATESCGDIDTTAWTADVNATVGRSVVATTWPVNGYYTGGPQITATATANGNASIISVERPAVTPGTEYLGSLYLRPPTSSASVWVELRWYTSSGTLISSTRATLGQTSTGLFRQYVSAVAPAGAATVGMAAGITSATAGQVLGIEGAIIRVMPAMVEGTTMPYTDASFEQGVGAWTTASGVATMARSIWAASSAIDGTYWVQVSSATATSSVLKSARYAVVPGENWKCQLFAASISGTWTVTIALHWYDASGTSLSTHTGTPAVLTGGGWWTVWEDMTPPTGAATAAIELTVSVPTTSATMAIDAVSLAPALPESTATSDSDNGVVTIVMRDLTVSQTMTLWRVVGGVQQLVRGPDGLLDHTPVTTSYTVQDYEAPLGVPLTYRAEFWASDGSAAGNRNLTADPLTTADPSDCWLKDPLQPQRNVMLRASAAPDWQRPIQEGTYRVRGRRNAVVRWDVRGGLEGTLQVWTDTDVQRQALHYLLDTGDVLLLQFPPGLGLEDMYVFVATPTEARFISYGGEPRRLWSLALIQQDQPVGGVLGSATWTVQDVKSTYSTVLDVLHTYGAVLDLAVDQREV